MNISGHFRCFLITRHDHIVIRGSLLKLNRRSLKVHAVMFNFSFLNPFGARAALPLN